jgi:hypothetical protein
VGVNIRSRRSASSRVEADTKAVPATFISAAIACICDSDRLSASRTAAAGLSANARSVKTSTLTIGMDALKSASSPCLPVRRIPLA